MVLDNLAVSITSQVADVKAGISSVRNSFVDLGATAQGTAGRLDEASDEMDEAKRSAFGLSAASQLLQGRLDEAGDEATELGVKSGFAAGLVTTLGLSSDGAALGITALSTSLTVALIPAILTLATILAPLTATLVALAAITGGVAGGFAAVIGTGVIAGFNELKEIAQDTIPILRRLLVGVGEEFVPILKDALFALPGLLADVINAAGDLTPFANALSELGSIGRQALPGLVATLADLGRDALPSIIAFAERLVEDGPAAFRAFKQSADETIPILKDIGGALLEIGPPLLEFGQNVLELAGPALVELIELGADVLTFVNNLTPNIRNLTIGVAALAPVILGLVSVLGGPFTAAFLGVLALVALWEDNFLGVRDTVSDVADDIMDAFGDVKDVLEDVIDDISDAFDGFVRSAVEMLNGLISGVNDLIKALNSTGLTDIEMIESVDVPESAQTSTAQFSRNRQQQRQMIDVKVSSDDEKFSAEVRQISNDEIGRMSLREADRADRNRPI